MRITRRNILLVACAATLLTPASGAAADETSTTSPSQQVFVEPLLGRKPVVSKTAALPNLDLKSFQNAHLPGSITNDRGLHLGSIGSGLFRVGEDTYWTVTDRGPTSEVGDRRAFVVPKFTPALVLVKVDGDSVTVQRSIALTTSASRPVTGLPNFARSGDSAPYAADAKTRINYNANGLDTEGVVQTPDGRFWVVDEYGPSIVEIATDGHVLTRYVPAGLQDNYKRAGVSYPVKGTLPAEFAKRRENRGFEDIALLPDGKTVVVALQSTLLVDGDKDRIITKLLTFDTATGQVKNTYGYRFDKPSTFASGTRGRDLKISALVPVDDNSVIVQERTDDEARFRLVTLNPKDNFITEADKRTVANLAKVDRVPAKLEGAALKDRSTLVISSDDDFGFVSKAYSSGQNVKSSGVRTRFIEVKLK
jgi:hypothetical protein